MPRAVCACCACTCRASSSWPSGCGATSKTTFLTVPVNGRSAPSPAASHQASGSPRQRTAAGGSAAHSGQPGQSYQPHTCRRPVTAGLPRPRVRRRAVAWYPGAWLAVPCVLIHALSQGKSSPTADETIRTRHDRAACHDHQDALGDRPSTRRQIGGILKVPAGRGP